MIFDRKYFTLYCSNLAHFFNKLYPKVPKQFWHSILCQNLVANLYIRKTYSSGANKTTDYFPFSYFLPRWKFKLPQSSSSKHDKCFIFSTHPLVMLTLSLIFPGLQKNYSCFVQIIICLPQIFETQILSIKKELYFLSRIFECPSACSYISLP